MSFFEATKGAKFQELDYLHLEEQQEYKPSSEPELTTCQNSIANPRSYVYLHHLSVNHHLESILTKINAGSTFQHQKFE